MKKWIGLFMAMLVVMSFPLALAEEQDVDVALEADVNVDVSVDGSDGAEETDGSTEDPSTDDGSDAGSSDGSTADETVDEAEDGSTDGEDSSDTDESTEDGSADSEDSADDAEDSGADDAADDGAASDDGNATDDATEDDAGVTPDSPLWGIERALERIDLALTLNKSKKAKKGLAHARERLAEVQLMIAAKKAQHAEKAQQAHDEDLAGVEEAVDDLESDGNSDVAEEALGEVSEIRENLASHAAKVAEVKDRILARQRAKMTPEQIAHLEKVFGKIKAKAAESEQKASAKREKVKGKATGSGSAGSKGGSGKSGRD